MIKSSLLAVLICGISHLSFSQKSPIQIGAHGNLNINSARGKSFTGDQPGILPGVGFGLDLRYKVSDHFSVFAIPSIDQNGWAYRSVFVESTTPGGPLQEADVLKRLAYINLPFVAVYTFGKHTIFHAGAGAFAGYLAESLLMMKRTDGSSTSSSGSDSFEVEKDFNYGVTSTLGATIPLSKHLHLNISLLNNFGLADISTGSSSIKLNTFSTSVGCIYSF